MWKSRMTRRELEEQNIAFPDEDKEEQHRLKWEQN